MNIHANTPYEIRDGETIRRAFTGSVIKSMDKETRQIEFVISTAAKDRYGDVITVSGWDLKKYKTNPVVLFGHLSSIPPIGKAIKTWKDGDALRSIAQFMTPDLSAFADSIFRMYLEGYLRAVSVGFLPIKYEHILDENGEPTFGYKFIKQDLLEFSSVPIPANAEALVAARQKGIDTLPFKAWAEEMLDNWQVVNRDLDTIYGVGRKDVENIRRRAAGLGATIQLSSEMQDELLRKNLDAVRKSKAEKAASKEFETVEIADEEHEVPVRNLKDGEVIGTLEIASLGAEDAPFLIDIVKADDLVMVEPAAMTFDGEIISVTTSDYEGGSMLLLNILGKTRNVSYELIGVDTDGRLFASKVKDTAMEEKEDVPDEVIEKEETTEVEPTVTEEGRAEPAATVEPELVVEPMVTKEVEDLLDFAGVLTFTEKVLNKFEDSLGEFNTITKHEERKKFFLASYMRELADQLDGGKQVTEEKAVVVQTIKTDKAVSFSTSDDVNTYLKNVTDQLQPMLAEIITSKLAKLRGRLD